MENIIDISLKKEEIMQKRTLYILPAMLLVLPLVFVAPSVFANNNV